jgi:Tannase and feruloyl esterase
MLRKVCLVVPVLVGLVWPATAQVRVSESDCTVARLGDSIDVSAIGEPVSAVTLSAPTWTESAGGRGAYCSIDGKMAPVDTAPTARPINFRVALPASWNRKAAQLGGGGFNGTIPNLNAGPLGEGYVTYGSDSGHQMAGFGGRGRGRGAAPPGASSENFSDDWSLNDEAMRNLGYMQMKKTHDAAMVLVERMYGRAPEFNYFIGTSQGGREALTVASRYPQDYDGIIANVPIVNFSSLMLAPELIRIQEIPLANWVTPAKVNAIRGEFMRQCDGLDGLTDGIMNNYMACRDRFDVSDGDPSPWGEKRCAGNVDPDPADTSADACLTDGQISTLEFVYRPYEFATPLANGVTSFGMWVPTTDPSGSGLILNARFRGQEGAAPDAPVHTHLGTLGVTGFLMQDLDANPIDYVEGGRLNDRRVEISGPLDGTIPDFGAFMERGGKMLVTIGTNDTLASPGSQLAFYQSVIDTMGRETVDGFARFFVLPQTGHGLSGTSYTTDGDGNAAESFPIPNTWDRLGVLTDWVERGVAPARQLTVTAGERSLPMCSYPEYPSYEGGPEQAAASYRCARP